jgi:hypothetical protein
MKKLRPTKSKSLILKENNFYQSFFKALTGFADSGTIFTVVLKGSEQ